MGKYNTTYVCSKCGKDFDEGWHPGYFILFDKCRGKTCPDCGRIRKLGKVKCFYENLSKPGSEGRSLFGCGRCDKTAEHFFNSVCKECFYEVQKEKNSCFCPLKEECLIDHYYCTFCEEFHGFGYITICKECMEKQEERDAYAQKRGTSFGVILISIFGGVIIGFFLGWLLFKKLRKKSKND